MNTKNESRRYYPTAFALYVTYFVLGIAASIMGQYKQNFAALWGAETLADGSYNVSGVVAVIAAIGLGRLIAFPVAGPLSDKLGRRLSALIGCVLYAIFLLSVTFTTNMYVCYVLAIISGMANSFLDTSITPSCMEIFKEKGTIANMFTKLSISIAQFLLPFAISFVAVNNLPFNTIFIATAAIIIVDGIFLAFLPFPPMEHAAPKNSGEKIKKEKMKFTPSAIILICLGFTTSTTFMLWMNCNQELGTLYGLADILYYGDDRRCDAPYGPYTPLLLRMMQNEKPILTVTHSPFNDALRAGCAVPAGQVTQRGVEEALLSFTMMNGEKRVALGRQAGDALCITHAPAQVARDYRGALLRLWV